ncbi:MAG TPA: ABC transporter permease, partial [Trebonia sp.]|nr:ABC transporter permease [Trebonia sp.]
ALPLARALRYAASLRAVPAPAAAVDKVLRELDLAGRPAVPVGELTGGERKRAAIAAELLAEPRLLFLEEPTTGLDPARGRELMRVLRSRCDTGLTVVLTTQNTLDADRCDKVAVLAAGGHLAFFGTPAAACEYFGADSLDEIYERLAGLGDPAAAWSRRFFSFFPRTGGGVSPVPTVPPQPGPARLVPDSAGPHSAGPVSDDPPGADLTASGLADDPSAAAAADLVNPSPAGRYPPHGPASRLRAAAARVFRPVRQWAVLTKRNAEAAARSRPALATLAGPPVAVLLTFCVASLAAGTAAVPFWAAFGGFFVGLAYGLPQVHAEVGVLRRERFAGLSAGAYVLAKATVLLPLLGGAAAVLAAVLRAVGQPGAGGGYGSTFLTMLLSAAAALGLGLLLSAGFSARAPAPAAAAFLAPQLLFAAAIFTLLDRPAWGDWLMLAICATGFFAAVGVLIARMGPAPRLPRD